MATTDKIVSADMYLSSALRKEAVSYMSATYDCLGSGLMRRDELSKINPDVVFMPKKFEKGELIAYGMAINGNIHIYGSSAFAIPHEFGHLLMSDETVNDSVLRMLEKDPIAGNVRGKLVDAFTAGDYGKYSDILEKAHMGAPGAFAHALSEALAYFLDSTFRSTRYLPTISENESTSFTGHFGVPLFKQFDGIERGWNSKGYVIHSKLPPGSDITYAAMFGRTVPHQNLISFIKECIAEGLIISDDASVGSTALSVIFNCIKHDNVYAAVDFSRMTSNYPLKKGSSKNEKFSVTTHYLGKMLALLSFAATDYNIKETLQLLRSGFKEVVPAIQSITKKEYVYLEKAKEDAEHQYDDLC